MRFLLLLSIALLSIATFSSRCAAEPAQGQPALLTMTEFSTDGYSELMKLKILRYNAGLKAFRFSNDFYNAGKIPAAEFANAGDDLVAWTLDLYSDPAIRIEVLRKRLEFMTYLCAKVDEGTSLGSGRLILAEAQMAAKLYDAKVELLEATQRLNAASCVK